ncbi:MAG: HEPN domain-containing protein [bacterium]|nr:HEPN domain-containing protein [Candidatus Limimorpha caballi]
MSLNEEERAILVAREYEKAQQFCKEAIGNAELGFWNVVANRLYYAPFHAVSAMLIKDHHQVGTHKGVVALYGQHYVKTGIMTQAEGRIYSQLQSMREKADYNCVFETAREEIEPMIVPTKQLIDKVGVLIGQQ